MQDEITKKIQGINLLEKIGALGLPEEDQAQILADASEIILEATMIKVVEQLSEENSKEVNKLFKEEKGKEALALIDKEVPTFLDILDKEIEAFAKEAIDTINEE